MVKFLHTADWHVGKTLRGRDRLDEQKAVLAEIAGIAEAHQVDAVLVAGDVYDSSAPSAPAQNLVVKTLLRMRRAGAEVIVIAGNHDHGPTFEAYRPLMGEVGITLAGAARTPDNGGVVRFAARSDGADTRVAILPFLSQRWAVRAAEIVANTPAENVRAYDEQVRQVITSLTAGFGGGTVNVVMSHLTCIGGVFGGGERPAQSIFEYSVPATIFPVSAHYVALGHLHRRQTLPAHAPVHYSGSPLAVDFGEQDNTSVACLVEAAPGIPARVTDIPHRIGATAADRTRDAGRAGGSGLVVRRGLPARVAARADPRRAARRCGRDLAQRPRRAHRPRVRGARPGATGRSRPNGTDSRATLRRVLRCPAGHGPEGDRPVQRVARRGHHDQRRLTGGNPAMRPILLDMNGFASFREQARVDFSDADFFALVGPTGSGKSTVIDAMTFALYGSVPRWGRKGMVSLALAPTVTRGTVKLVFEVERQRYVVARELRRAGSQVNQRAASLELLMDPSGLANPGDPTAPMAKDLAGVTEAVEKLLGLSFEDFCQCVVLPQGQFASFLHAKPADRQEILLRLLGADHYKRMMETANHRASAAAQRAVAIGETLLGYADATPAAQDEARAREVTLGQLAARVEEVLPRIREAQQELTAADAQLRARQQEQAALALVRVPDGAGALDESLAASRAAAQRLRAAEQAAEAADTAARAALAAGPERAPLLLVRERRAERDRDSGRLPGLALEASRLAAASRDATAATRAAEVALEGLRDRREEASRTLSAASEQVARLQAEHGRLTAVTVPGEVAALDERRAATERAAGETARDLEEAERADAEARSALSSAVPAAPLAQVSRDLAELRGVLADVAAARNAAGTAHDEQEAATAALAQARVARDARQRAVDDANRAHVVAGLRPHLMVGEACPVCEQTVATLPAPVHAPEVAAGRALLQEADRALADAQRSAQQADAKAARADASLAAKLDRQSALVRSLAGTLRGPLSSAPLPATRAVVSAGAVAAGVDVAAGAGVAASTGAISDDQAGAGPVAAIGDGPRGQRGRRGGRPRAGPGGAGRGGRGCRRRGASRAGAQPVGAGGGDAR